MRLVVLAAVTLLFAAAGAHSKRSMTPADYQRLRAESYGNRKPQKATSAHCPPHPLISNIDAPLPQSIVTLITDILNQTLTSCTGPAASASGSTATGVSASIVFGSNAPQFINLGCTDRNTPNVLPTEDSVYYLGSVSKTFATQVIYDAVAQGKVSSLDEQVQVLVPEFSLLNFFGSQCEGSPTWRQILAHMGGLQREAPCSVTECSASGGLNTTQILERLSHFPYILPFNSRPSYSNLGFDFIGNAVAERAFNMSFANYLSTVLAPRYGIYSTGTTLSNSSILERMVKQYLVSQNEPFAFPALDWGWLAPAGGVYSSNTDLARWLTHWIQEFNTTAVGKAHFQPSFVNGGQSAMGTPWEFQHMEGWMVATKGGNNPGVTALLMMVPELQYGISVTWNGQGINEETIAIQIANATLSTITMAVEQLRKTQFPSYLINISTLAGKYVSNVNRFGAEVVAVSVQGLNIGVVVSWFGQAVLWPVHQDPTGMTYQLFDNWAQSPTCLSYELGATSGQFIRFQQNGTQVTFVIPGLDYVDTFYRL